MNSRPIFAIADLETTALELPAAEIVEYAIITNPGAIAHSGLVKPINPIPAESSSVHHIIGEDVESAPTWAETSPLVKALLAEADYAVAHNADFEKKFLGALVPDKPWICTFKCSLRAWPDAPTHSNEGLRYWLQLGNDRGRAGAQKPHSALHDANVTGLILDRLLASHPLETLQQWSNEIALLPTCPIGKWRGRKWPEVEWGFLEWIVYKAFDMREDCKHAARLELKRRAEERL